jgi:hypothetical protein
MKLLTALAGVLPLAATLYIANHARDAATLDARQTTTRSCKIVAGADGKAYFS